jgi:DNA-binding transcriptional LysR family regulator
MVDLRHLRTFCTVNDSHGFTSAAQRLGCSQPTVSAHIQALENELGGVRLFERARFSRDLVLTEVGQQVLRHSRKLLDLAEQTPTVIQQLPYAYCLSAVGEEE